MDLTSCGAGGNWFATRLSFLRRARQKDQFSRYLVDDLTRVDVTLDQSAVIGGKWIFDACGCAVASAKTETAAALLENEARVLDLLGGKFAPRLVRLTRSVRETRLTREYITGRSLAEYPRSRWTRPLREFSEHLKEIHDAGVIHADLKASNLIVAEKGLVAIDWEHALPRGVRLASWPRRAVSLGLSSPDVIWGRGSAEPEVDWYALERLKEQSVEDYAQA